jgi:hypothetical protein
LVEGIADGVTNSRISVLTADSVWSHASFSLASAIVAAVSGTSILPSAPGFDVGTAVTGWVGDVAVDAG